MVGQTQHPCPHQSSLVLLLLLLHHDDDDYDDYDDDDDDREPKQLVPLPRTPSASNIIDEFLDSRKQKAGLSTLQYKRIVELMEGVR